MQTSTQSKPAPAPISPEALRDLAAALERGDVEAAAMLALAARAEA